MNNFLKIILAHLLLSICLPAFADYATADYIRGNVFVERNRKKIVLRQKDKILQDDIISTKKKSFIKILFNNKSTFSLGQESKVKMLKLNIKETKNIELIQGYIRSKFDKIKTGKHKIIVSTKSAIIGIRGTEFSMIYNPQNKITTTIGYSGKVEFTKIFNNKEDFSKAVVINKGQFSTTKSKTANVTTPILFSPEQFSALQSNADLETSTKQKRKNSTPKSIKNVPVIRTQDIPTQFLGPGHNQVIANFENSQRPGGYIDIDSGLYIEPPESSEFDSESGVYRVDKEFGGYDPETGEYIPPLGILLHPLKGFVAASDILASASKIIREKTLDITKGAISGVSAVGNTVYDGAKTLGTGVINGVSSVGKTIEDNTGVVGKTIGTGVKYIGNTTLNTVKTIGQGTVDTVTKTSEVVSDTTVKTLDIIAENMNKYFNHGFLHDNAKKVSSLPLINRLDLQIRNELSLASVHDFSIYDQLHSLNTTESFRNTFHFSSQYKQIFHKKVFVRPRFFTNRIDYLKDHESFTGLERYEQRYGIDIGAMGKVSGAIIQSYFYLDYGNYFKEESLGSSYEEYLWDKRFGFSKLIIGQESITSRFDYYYTEYYSNSYDKGHINNFKLTEIINLENKNYIDLSLYWSERTRNLSGKNAKLKGMKLEYLYQSQTKNFNVSVWGDYQEHTDDLVMHSRGIEEQTEFGIKFNRGFGKFFSTVFKIYATQRESADPNFSSDNKTLSLAFAGSY